MLEKAPTYRVDEALLRSKLLGYDIELNPGNCSAIEEQVATIRFKKSFNLPKINYKIAASILLVAALVTVIGANFHSIKDLFAPAPQTKEIENKPLVVEPKPAINTPAQTAEVNPAPTPTVTLQAPVQDAMAKADTLAGKKTDSSKQENAKKPIPVMAQPPSDSAAKAEGVNKQDTSLQRSDAPVKKKKKRRRRNANIDELKESTLQPSADDDVVVPQ